MRGTRQGAGVRTPEAKTPGTPGPGGWAFCPEGAIGKWTLLGPNTWPEVTRIPGPGIRSPDSPAKGPSMTHGWAAHVCVRPLASWLDGPRAGSGARHGDHAWDSGFRVRIPEIRESRTGTGFRDPESGLGSRFGNPGCGMGGIQYETGGKHRGRDSGRGKTRSGLSRKLRQHLPGSRIR